MIKLPYFKQDTNYSCGPAVIQMIFRFYGKVFSEEDLIQRLKTQKDIGTQHQSMIEVARTEGFYVYVNNESSLNEIIFFLNKNIPVIVHYVDDGVGHYSVVVKVDEDNVVLDDPWNGEKFKINREQFEKIWHNEKGNFKKWIMVVSNEYRHLGKQYLPKI